MNATTTDNVIQMFTEQQVELADRMLKLFNPAKHAYGRYSTQGSQIAGQKWKGDAKTFTGPVTVQLMAEHLTARTRIGFVPVHHGEQGLCYFGAIDVDKYYGLDHKQLAQKIKEKKLPLIVCKTKSGGAHLYLYISIGASSAQVFDILFDWSGKLRAGGAEVFPKQQQLEPTDEGNWINCPYFGDSCRAVDATGRELTLPEFLDAAEALSKQPLPQKVEEDDDSAGEFDLEEAAAILVEHWTKRHDLAFAVAGALARHEVDQDNIEALIRKAASDAGDEEIEERMGCVGEAFRALAQDRKVFGIPKLRELLDKDTDKFLAACGIDGLPQNVKLEDFYAHMPSHQYIFIPDKDCWPASSVDVALRSAQELRRGKKRTRASVWLDRNRPVLQMIWAPGEPALIENKIVRGGGWKRRRDAAVLNLYEAPDAVPGNARGAGPWLKLLCRLWPPYARRHILSYCAFKVQRPGEKINHALLLGGAPGIGKDTFLEPLKWAVGHDNFTEISPAHLLGRFNGFLKSVVLRVSEARDLGEVNRYALYEHMKTLTAAPPDVLRCDEKNLKEHSVFNVAGVIITTNHRTGGIYLPADDRRHFVAWSERTQADFATGYWRGLWAWYYSGGTNNVVAFLKSYDLTGWDAKAPPLKTEAFWAIVDSERGGEAAELDDVLETLGNPSVTTIERIHHYALGAVSSSTGHSELAEWLEDKGNRRKVAHRLGEAGYVPVRNPDDKSGYWKIAGRRQAVYGKAELSVQERLRAVREFIKEMNNEARPDM